ncbi:Nmad2 family putative nucleotide modification protein [Hymenobacter actinosclerus]|uniref:Nucleotide modification associated domain-containing protein n=1 Tax=Hymenobacter actinosclerus TaxID=82805 RepID=A0A1I0J9G2_9BACT|nr:hypothetical protein [Hymenobacter actinosclerus]SEU06614.1 hypothetical protein SAMN04487998_3736 [Hymenobacter actinosclerus]
MNFHSYVVTRDYGFAPNPFGEYCTLATCKPKIRSAAAIGDWVLGTGSKTLSMESKLVFAMQVGEALTFDEYWNDERFAYKKPVMNGSIVQMFGDNIYHHSGENWIQENSHHSNDDGSINPLNLAKDTKADRVLIGTKFYYFGKSAPTVPSEFDEIFKEGIGHKKVDVEVGQRLVDWLTSTQEVGLLDDPIQFDNNQFDRYSGK